MNYNSMLNFSYTIQPYPFNIYPIIPMNVEIIPNFNLPNSFYHYNRNDTSTNFIPKSELYLINGLRQLWEQHITWTRFTILSLKNDSPDTNLVTERLLRNPTDFEIALKPFYGNTIAAKFRELFRSHLEIAADLVKESKAGDKKAADVSEKKWYQNADEIAMFLSKINSYWSYEDWKTMLFSHLALTKSEAVDILTDDYVNSIAVYDDIEKQVLEMADIMAKGIINQFSQNFK